MVNLSEEEKKAIERVLDFAITHIDDYESEDNYKYIETVKNLIAKQQKEIDKLKEQNKKYQGIENETTIIYKSKAKYVREDFIKRYYVDKNKIRERIKHIPTNEKNEIRKYRCIAMRCILYELLKED
jgi:hypothetical protein